MVFLQKDAGFCFGVKAGVKTAEGLIGKENIFLFGELANNKFVVDGFKEKGMTVIGEEDINSLPFDGTVVIRAHGVTKNVYESLKSMCSNVIDCTCPKVKKIHEIVESKTGCVIIIGKKEHPEVIGTFGWCTNGTAVIAESLDELRNINLSGDVAVVAQTTCSRDLWADATAFIKEKNHEAEIYDTLCDVISKRLHEAGKISADSDYVIVAGDISSSNSKELYETCKKTNSQTFFVNSAADVKKLKLDTMSKKIGLVGGASTPKWILDEIHDYLVFDEFLSETKFEIESSSNAFLEKLINESDKPFIKEVIRDFQKQNQNGKRIRGAMIKLGAFAASGEVPKDYIDLAMAYEFFQTAILIHDDIIDNSYKRRGIPTIHSPEGVNEYAAQRKLSGGFLKDASVDVVKHFGISRAVCIGDYGLFLANKLVAQSDLPSDLKVKVFELFSQIQLTTLEGEIMDVTLPYVNSSIDDNYFRTIDLIYEYKTAWYTLTGPALLGGILGGADNETNNLLKEIMLPLGISFQIKDDLLGIYGDEEVLGKPALSDVAEKKQTLLYGFAYAHASEEEKQLLDIHYGNPNASNEDLEMVRQLFEKTGAKVQCENLLEIYSKKAVQSAEKFDEMLRPLFKGLIGYLLNRDK